MRRGRRRRQPRPRVARPLVLGGVAAVRRWSGAYPSSWPPVHTCPRPRTRESSWRPSARSPTDERRTVTTRYVVGADGANSLVRQWIGSTVTELGYFHDWLVIDLLMHAPLEDFDFSPPAWQLCDPARPTTLVPGGPGRRRFEFMRPPYRDRRRTQRGRDRVEPARAVGHHAHHREARAHTPSTPFRPAGVTPGEGTPPARRRLRAPHATLRRSGKCSGLRDASRPLLAARPGPRRPCSGTPSSTATATSAPSRSGTSSRPPWDWGRVILPTRPGRRRLERRDDEGGPRRRRPQPPRPPPRLGSGLHRDDAGGGAASSTSRPKSTTASGAGASATSWSTTGYCSPADPRLREGLRSEDSALLADLGWPVVALASDPGNGQVVST